MEVKNNSIHLCNSCDRKFPDCDGEETEVLFGDGKGHDNICCCNKYVPMLEHDYDRGGYK